MPDMEIVPVSALRDNYIWAVIEADRCVLVDPGEATPALNLLEQRGLSLAAILLTHRHTDHQGGVSDLLAHTEVPVFGPPCAAMPRVSNPLTDGAQNLIPGFGEAFSVLSVPGHTEEHIAYLWDKVLFCGDTLFGAGCGRLLGGTAAQLHASLRRLAALPADTQVCCAHEYTLSNLAFALAAEPDNPRITQRQTACQSRHEKGLPTLPSTMGEELATNPFLRCDQTSVRQMAEKIAGGMPCQTSLQVFAALRAWKDRF